MIASVTADVDAYDFSHAALGFYAFFWSELCDWYLEIVKPRLYDGDADAAANLLYVLERVLALSHPMMPFVTEEIWSYLPDRDGLLIGAAFPEADESLVDADATSAVAAEIGRVRKVRRWRDLVGVPAGAVLEARIKGDPPEFLTRLARLEPASNSGSPLATIGTIEILASEEIDADEANRRIEAERERLRGEVERGERKLGNQGFVAKAPEAGGEDHRDQGGDNQLGPPGGTARDRGGLHRPAGFAGGAEQPEEQPSDELRASR